MPRVNDYCKEAEKTLEEAWVTFGCDKNYGVYKGPESWEKMFLADDLTQGFQTIEKGEPSSWVIDSGIKSAGTIPGLEKCLGLKHIENPDIKAVCQINNVRAGENIRQRTALQLAWKAEVEEKLKATPFIGGAEPIDEDHHCYDLMTKVWDKKGMMRLDPVTEETFPCMTKWMAAMADKKK